MARYAEFETTIKGGLPVLVKARIYPPEYDVGIFSWQPEPEFFWTSGKPLSIDVPKSDMERIEDECLENME